MDELVYRISPQEELEVFKKLGSLHGGELDKSSGFIHLSKASQVAFVLDKFLPGRTGLYLLAIDTTKIAEGLKYEKVDGIVENEDDSFPHFYGPSGSFSPLPLEALVKAHKLEVENGKHVLPFAGSS